MAGNYFRKTKENIFDHSQATNFWMINARNYYRMKEKISTFAKVIYFKDIKGLNPTIQTGHAAGVVKVHQVFSGIKQ